MTTKLKMKTISKPADSSLQGNCQAVDKRLKNGEKALLNNGQCLIIKY